jgi:glycosyltransferase involved in cell wall biosynthesis
MQSEVKIQFGGKRSGSHPSPAGLHQPLITIIMPVFNGAKTLESAILSVKRQDFGNLEFIIVDGASTDGTLEIIRKHELSIDYWVSEPDLGIYDAINKGVRLARGRWLYILGSDDTLRDSLRAVAQFLCDEHTVYYGNVFRTRSKRLYEGAFGPWKLSRRNICQQAIFYPRSLFDERQFDLRYRLLADWEFNIRTYSDSRFQFQFIPVTIADYNDLTGVSSVATDVQFWMDYGRLLGECMPWPVYAWFQFKRTIGLFPWSILHGQDMSGASEESHCPARKDNVHPGKLSQQRRVEEKVPKDAE